MAEVTRRAFLGTGTGAAAGLALAAAPAFGAGSVAAAAAAGGHEAATVAPVPAPEGAFVVHVADAATGELSVMSGESAVLVHDPALVARLAAAASGH
jgi:hypothetical protein